MNQYEVLLCDSDPIWSEKLRQSMEEEGICLAAVEEMEELWQRKDGCQGIIIGIQEIDSMLFWGKPDQAGLEEQRYQVLQRLRLIQPKIITVIPASDYEQEYRCLLAGASECIHKEQPLYLIRERLKRLFSSEQEIWNLHFGEVSYHIKKNLLTYQDQGITLTGIEQQVMEQLMRNGRSLTDKTELLLQIWNKADNPQRHRMNTVIQQLRAKIEKMPLRIVTCYGKGYYLSDRRR